MKSDNNNKSEKKHRGLSTEYKPIENKSKTTARRARASHSQSVARQAQTLCLLCFHLVFIGSIFHSHGPKSSRFFSFDSFFYFAQVFFVGIFTRIFLNTFVIGIVRTWFARNLSLSAIGYYFIFFRFLGVDKGIVLWNCYFFF